MRGGEGGYGWVKAGVGGNGWVRVEEGCVKVKKGGWAKMCVLRYLPIPARAFHSFSFMPDGRR